MSDGEGEEEQKEEQAKVISALSELNELFAFLETFADVLPYFDQNGNR